MTRTAVKTLIWVLVDRVYDILDWHDYLLATGFVPIVPYDPRNTDGPKIIEYRVEDRFEEHSESVQLKQSVLDETYNYRTGVECSDDTVHARTEVFVASVYGPSLQSPTTREETSRL